MYVADNCVLVIRLAIDWYAVAEIGSFIALELIEVPDCIEAIDAHLERLEDEDWDRMLSWFIDFIQF